MNIYAYRYFDCIAGNDRRNGKVKRAQDKGLAEIYLHNLRDYTTNKWRRVDDYPFGGEAGMVMQIEPIDRAISALKEERTYDEVIYTSPDGETFNQPMANQMSLLNNLIILCGHYKGIDYRKVSIIESVSI